MASVRVTKTAEQIILEAFAPLLKKICRAQIVYYDAAGKPIISMDVGPVSSGDRIESFRVPTIDDITLAH